MFTYFNEMYFVTYAQFVPFFMAFIYGHHWFMLSGKERRSLVDMNRKILKLLVLTSVICSFFPAVWNTFKLEVHPVISSAYVAFSKVIWTTGFLSFFSLYNTRGNHTDHVDSSS